MTKHHGKFIVFVDVDDPKNIGVPEAFNEVADYGIVRGVTEAFDACENTEVRVYGIDYLLSQVRKVIRGIGERRGIQPGANTIAAQLTEADVIAALTPPQEG